MGKKEVLCSNNNVLCSTSSHHRECTRGGFCNFMHLKPISRELRRELYGRRRKRYWKPSLSKTRPVPLIVVGIFVVTEMNFLSIRHRSRSRSRERRSRSRDRSRGGRERERRRSRDRERSGRFWAMTQFWCLCFIVFNQWPALVWNIRCHLVTCLKPFCLSLCVSLHFFKCTIINFVSQ